MPAASPITRQTVGLTFSVALAVLGLGVLAQLGGVGGAFVARFQAAKKEAAAAGDLPMFARLTVPVGMRPDFSTDPFAMMVEEPLPGTGELRPPGAPPRPVPVASDPARPAESVPQTRFDELILQGKQLRERGDTGNALTKFREAGAMDPRNPVAIAELAATFDRMRLPERGAEHWKRIYEMGDTAGIYFSLAEAKLKETHARAILEAAPQVAPGPAAGAAAEGIAPGLVVGLGKLRIEERTEAPSLKRFTLLIPIKARPQARIEVRDLVIHVLFYDRLDGKNVVQTSANVNSKWITSPPDWTDTDTEELAVEYHLPKPEKTKRESREFHGYIVRVYYKQQLQASAAEPEQLAQQYPPPPTLKPNEP